MSVWALLISVQNDLLAVFKLDFLLRYYMPKLQDSR